MRNPTPKRIGYRLGVLRRRAQLSESELARRARVTRIYVRQLEAGRYRVTVDVAWRITQALGVALTELLQ
jgi:transcriptional regulator with XRE-family HTH domain